MYIQILNNRTQFKLKKTNEIAKSCEREEMNKVLSKCTAAFGCFDRP